MSEGFDLSHLGSEKQLKSVSERFAKWCRLSVEVLFSAFSLVTQLEIMSQSWVSNKSQNNNWLSEFPLSSEGPDKLCAAIPSEFSTASSISPKVNWDLNPKIYEFPPPSTQSISDQQNPRNTFCRSTSPFQPFTNVSTNHLPRLVNFHNKFRHYQNFPLQLQPSNSPPAQNQIITHPIST